MKYYCETIPVTLAEKLKEKGMPMPATYSELCYLGNPTYAQVFDWLMSGKSWLVDIGREYDFAAAGVTERFEWSLQKVGSFSEQPDNGGGFCDTWYEAANAAIEKVLTLI